MTALDLTLLHCTALHPPYVGLLEGRRVVDPVPGDGDHVAGSLGDRQCQYRNHWLCSTWYPSTMNSFCLGLVLAKTTSLWPAIFCRGWISQGSAGDGVRGHLVQLLLGPVSHHVVRHTGRVRLGGAVQLPVGSGYTIHPIFLHSSFVTHIRKFILRI